MDVCHYRALNKGEEQNSVKCILLGKKNPTGLIGNPGFTSCPVLEVWFWFMDQNWSFIILSILLWAILTVKI